MKNKKVAYTSELDLHVEHSTGNVLVGFTITNRKTGAEKWSVRNELGLTSNDSDQAEAVSELKKISGETATCAGCHSVYAQDDKLDSEENDFTAHCRNCGAGLNQFSSVEYNNS